MKLLWIIKRKENLMDETRKGTKRSLQQYNSRIAADRPWVCDVLRDLVPSYNLKNVKNTHLDLRAF